MVPRPMPQEEGKRTLTRFQRFRQNPVLFLAQLIYSFRPPLKPRPIARRQRAIQIVCIADTHTLTQPVANGDILVHAGDLTNTGSFEEIQAQLNWLNSLPHTHKVVVAGNHDLLLDEEFCAQYPQHAPAPNGGQREDLDWGSVMYLNDMHTTLAVQGRKITLYGLPLVPTCGPWAFQYDRILDVWKDKIPRGTDVLIAHGPPKGHLDDGGQGSTSLLQELWRQKPSLVVCGHVHEGRGMESSNWDHGQRLYDDVCLGEGGWGSVVRMSVWLAGQKILTCLRGRSTSSTTLVNAAVIGPDGDGRPAMVVKI